MKDIAWKKDWFPKIPKVERNYWKSEDNQRQFLHNLASRYHLVRSSDWRRVTSALIEKNGGRVSS